ncbi:uncharacterized protein LY79DRAFT_563982 [Colletotrichum navitas]|uniref:Uncharacterized protein n=1 Tax=Colletotrichum navitas TaxID=681940 RepID=A0AAD8PRR8_9PEZI|nr:uncharacterized protein LY79DRAFT_563982 [Colletotrichum navitas]KAK1579528.1 hypothetical protein LY79DRAFT_563982 [Colletotrichum navitas]
MLLGTFRPIARSRTLRRSQVRRFCTIAETSDAKSLRRRQCRVRHPGRGLVHNLAGPGPLQSQLLVCRRPGPSRPAGQQDVALGLDWIGCLLLRPSIHAPKNNNSSG